MYIVLICLVYSEVRILSITLDRFMSFKIMNSDNAINENVDLWSLGNCIFCKEKVEENSKILKCLHIICEDCTKREITDLGVCCKCKIETKGELIDFSIMSPIKPKEKICYETNCQFIAKKICMYCKSIYCNPCSKKHPEKNKDHNSDLMMTYPLKKEFVMCPKCMKKCIEVLCTKCSIMICSLCHLMYHKKHDYKLLSTMATRNKAELQTLLTELSKNNNYLSLFIHKSYENIEKLMAEKKKISDKIDEAMNKLHKEVDQRSLELKKILETNITNGVNSINLNKEVINDFKKENEYYHNLTSSVINHNKTFEYIKLSKIFTDKMVIVRSQIQDIPIGTRNHKVKLVYNDEQSMKKCVESIREMGNIISSPAVNPLESKANVSSNNVSRPF